VCSSDLQSPSFVGVRVSWRPPSVEGAIESAVDKVKGALGKDKGEPAKLQA